MTEKSFFETHPTWRNAFRWALALITVVVAVNLFGPDTVKAWITDGLAYIGIGNP